MGGLGRVVGGSDCAGCGPQLEGVDLSCSTRPFEQNCRRCLPEARMWEDCSPSRNPLAALSKYLLMPGAPLGMAPTAHVLYTRHLIADPSAPKWANRDRVVLSNGHACVLRRLTPHAAPLTPVHQSSTPSSTSPATSSRSRTSSTSAPLRARRPATPRCTRPRASRSPPGLSVRASRRLLVWPSRRRTWVLLMATSCSTTGLGVGFFSF